MHSLCETFRGLFSFSPRPRSPPRPGGGATPGTAAAGAPRSPQPPPSSPRSTTSHQLNRPPGPPRPPRHSPPRTAPVRPSVRPVAGRGAARCRRAHGALSRRTRGTAARPPRATRRFFFLLCTESRSGGKPSVCRTCGLRVGGREGRVCSILRLAGLGGELGSCGNVPLPPFPS